MARHRFVAALLMLAATSAAPQNPVHTDGDKYRAILDNACVRVLEYRDQPGDRTQLHVHPACVMYTLSSFRRRLHQNGQHRDVEIAAGTTGWLPAQEHAGENIGDTPTHVLFVELKKGGGSESGPALGPA